MLIGHYNFCAYWGLFAVDQEGRLTSPRNDRDDHDEHDAKKSDVANVAAVVIVAGVVSTADTR